MKRLNNTEIWLSSKGYRKADCHACCGKGRIIDEDRGRLARCQTCEGRGFAYYDYLDWPASAREIKNEYVSDARADLKKYLSLIDSAVRKMMLAAVENEIRCLAKTFSRKEKKC